MIKIKPCTAIFDDPNFIHGYEFSENTTLFLKSIKRNYPQCADVDIEKDYKWGVLFLLDSFGGKRKIETFNAYRRDLEKYFQWSWLVKGKSILDLKNVDVREFLEFIKNPPTKWIQTEVVKRYISPSKKHAENVEFRVHNHQWRPFVHKMKKVVLKDIYQQSLSFADDIQDSYIEQSRLDWLKKNPYSASSAQIKPVFTIMRRFYEFMGLNEITERNPWLGMKLHKYVTDKVQGGKKSGSIDNGKLVLRVSTKNIEMILTELKSRYQSAQGIAETVDAERAKSASLKRSKSPETKEAEKYARMHFSFAMIFSLYVRISELCANERHSPVMGDFFEREGNWFLLIKGKGDKTRKRSINTSVLDMLLEYRAFRGLTPKYPTVNDNNPIIPALRGFKGIGRRALTGVIQEAFDIGAQQAKANGDEVAFAELSVCTTHWLRHSGISIEVDSGRSFNHIMQDSGHETLESLSIYVDDDIYERHDSNNVLMLDSLH